MTNNKETWEELEKEIEGRLQMIPSSYDRRKMRGLIQRVITFKSSEISKAKREVVEEVEKELEKRKTKVAKAPNSVDVGIQTLGFNWWREDFIQSLISKYK